MGVPRGGVTSTLAAPAEGGAAGAGSTPAATSSRAAKRFTASLRGRGEDLDVRRAVGRVGQARQEVGHVLRLQVLFQRLQALPLFVRDVGLVVVRVAVQIVGQVAHFLPRAFDRLGEQGGELFVPA